VRPIRALDVWRRIHRVEMLLGAGALLTDIVSAQPPSTTTAPSATAPAAAARHARELLPSTTRFSPGSNAYGLGGQATENGRGMVLGNPHFPWDGPQRFYEVHLTIPGEIDVLGASLYGFPAVNIGHNEHVGWSHTVSTAHRFTPFALQLVPGQPTRHVLDGKQVPMQAQRVTVDVLGADGRTERRSHTMYLTRFGPVFTGFRASSSGRLTRPMPCGTPTSTTFARSTSGWRWEGLAPPAASSAPFSAIKGFRS
jgi:acyl-homoserine-lactone acylase